MSKEEVLILSHVPSKETMRLVGLSSLNLFIKTLSDEAKAQWELKLSPTAAMMPLNHYHPVVLPPRPTPRAARSIANTRKYKRIEIGLRVLIVSGERIFRTHSKNISQGGILLSDPVPETFISDDCMIILQSPDRDENVEVPISFVGQLSDRTRIKFEKGEYIAHISKWLVQLSTDQKAA